MKCKNCGNEKPTGEEFLVCKVCFDKATEEVGFKQEFDIVPHTPIKVYEITPAYTDRVDSVFVEAGNSWKPALEAIEQALEYQYDDEYIIWGDIEVKVKCGYMTRQRLDELEKV